MPRLYIAAENVRAEKAATKATQQASQQVSQQATAEKLAQTATRIAQIRAAEKAAKETTKAKQQASQQATAEKNKADKQTFLALARSVKAAQTQAAKEKVKESKASKRLLTESISHPTGGNKARKLATGTSRASKEQALLKQTYERKKELRAGRPKITSILIPTELDFNLLGTKEDCTNIITRYFASTNVAMSMNYDVRTTQALISTFANVTQERKEELKTEWRSKMGFAKPIPACAACGIRALNIEFTTLSLSDLSASFVMEEGSATMSRLLKLRAGVELLRLDERGNILLDAEEHFVLEQVDLSSIMSFYVEPTTGVIYYLHGDLVETNGEFACCANCLDYINIENESRRVKANDKDKPPGKHSSCRALALGYDYGNLTRVSNVYLPKLSALESTILSPNRLYQVFFCPFVVIS